MKLTGKNTYYVLLCDCSEKGRADMMICGVFTSKKEAQDYNRGDLEECPAKHYVKKCKVTVEIEKLPK